MFCDKWGTVVFKLFKLSYAVQVTVTHYFAMLPALYQKAA